jgi:hypothetical protein
MGQLMSGASEAFTAILFPLLAFFVSIQRNPFDK